MSRRPTAPRRPASARTQASARSQASATSPPPRAPRGGAGAGRGARARPAAPAVAGRGRAAVASVSSVSATSVRRFAARARAVRRVALRPLLGALAAAGLLALAAWVVLASPLLTARSVEVVGVERVPAAEVAALGDTALGTPMARLDTGVLARRVEGLPMVRSAEVLRVWPGTLEVRVVERVPLAAVPAADGVHVVDGDGVVVQVLADVPADLPLVEADAAGRPDALRETTTVLQALPDDVRALVERAGASSRDSVTLHLRGGAQVVWGSADDSAFKAEVLRVLLTQPAGVYDVSSPTTPVTR